MPRKASRKVVVRLKRKKPIRLSTFSKLLKSDLIRLEEDSIINDCITILEDKLVNLNLPNLNEIISLKNEFLYNSNQLLKNSKQMINFIIYFISSNHDKFNKCGNRMSISNLPENFDDLLKLFFKNDCKDKKDDIKNDLIKLNELINDYQLQIVANSLRREKMQSRSVRVDDLNVHSSDLLEFKSLALKLDKLVFNYYQLRYKSFRFRSDVIYAITKRYIKDLKILVQEFDNSMVLIQENQDLDYLIKKSGKKQAELKEKKSKSEECDEIENEVKQLIKKVDEKEHELDKKAKELDILYQDKMDENAISLLDKSEEYREITKSLILQFKLSRKIKQILVKMVKLIDTRFKLKYPNLNESNYFLNEIDDILISEVITALDHFAKERDAQKRIEKRKQDKKMEEEKLNEKSNEKLEDGDLKNKQTKTDENDKDDKKEAIQNDDVEKNEDKSIKDKEEVKLDENTCANVKVR